MRNAARAFGKILQEAGIQEVIDRLNVQALLKGLMMKLSFVGIRPELKPYIQSFWVFESAIGIPASDSSLVVPDGCPKLIFHCENSITAGGRGRICVSEEQGLYFVGNQDSSTLLQTSRRKTRFIGIDFYPHGAYPIFGIPMGEVSNLRLDADVIFSRRGRELTEIIRNHETVQQKIECLQEHLINLLHEHKLQNSIVDFCVESLHRTHGLMSVRDLERSTGYTRRYLNMLFIHHVGLSPKVLGGIFRFQKFYRKWAEKGSFDELKADLYDYYYDQAHFTKEFKRMTGFPPERFTREVANEFGRLPHAGGSRVLSRHD